MSGKLNKPLLEPAQAQHLLDEVVYESVLACVDLDQLLGIESGLWAALEDVGTSKLDCPLLAKELVDRALRRICDEPRRYMAFDPANGADEALRDNASCMGKRRDAADDSRTVPSFECELCDEAMGATPTPAKRNAS